MTEQKQKRRKYYRKCGNCGKRNEQSFMKRVSNEYSNNGWLCEECYVECCLTQEDYLSEFDNFY